MLVQAYLGLGQHAKALPLAERYVQANPKAGDTWLQFLVAGNAELKRYQAAERWQQKLLLRHSDQETEEHTSELQSLMRISYPVFCLKNKITRAGRQRPP